LAVGRIKRGNILLPCTSYVQRLVLTKADRHRHTIHLEVKKEKDRKEGVKSSDGVPGVTRQEAARLILRVFPKLRHEWKRIPLALPGWEDSL
jgi:hypothetical protein